LYICYVLDSFHILLSFWQTLDPWNVFTYVCICKKQKNGLARSPAADGSKKNT